MNTQQKNRFLHLFRKELRLTQKHYNSKLSNKVTVFYMVASMSTKELIGREAVRYEQFLKK